MFNHCILCLYKKALRLLRASKSDRRGSNPRSRPWQGRALPTPPLSHKRVMGIEPTYPAWKAGVLPLNYTRTACCLCISVASTKISIYDETVFVNTKFKFFSVFLKTYTNYHLADNFVRRIKSSVSLLSSIPNNCYAVYQKELSLLLI